MFKINRTTAKLMSAIGAVCCVAAGIFLLSNLDKTDPPFALSAIVAVFGILMFVASLAFFTEE